MYTHLDGAHSRVKVGDFKIGRIARDRKPHLTNDVLNDPEIGDPAWARREGMVAFAGYPLIVESRVVGVLALFSRQALAESVLHRIETAWGTESHSTSTVKSRKKRSARQRSAVGSCWLPAARDLCVDLEGKCTFANPACARLLGYADAGDLLGKPAHELFHHTRPDGTPYPREECRIDKALRQRKGR